MTPTDLTAPELLDELLKLAQEATPGPWIIGAFGYVWPESDIEIVGGMWANRVPEPFIIHSTNRDAQNYANAAFIASANPATITALLADHSRLREEVERLEGIIRKFWKGRFWSGVTGHDELEINETLAAIEEPKP